MTNPLDFPGTEFQFELMNPNPAYSPKSDIKRISFQVTPEVWDLFVSLGYEKRQGLILECSTHVPEAIPTAPPEKKGDHSGYARKLHAAGIFRMPKLWKALGSDDEYRQWIREQPSCVTGYKPCEAAHVRRAGESGTGYKAQYACVPLLPEEHKLQHQSGEYALLHSAYPISWKFKGVEEAKEWFNKQRLKYVEQWAHEKLKEKLGYLSLTDVPPDAIRVFLHKHGIEAP